MTCSFIAMALISPGLPWLTLDVDGLTLSQCRQAPAVMADIVRSRRCWRRHDWPVAMQTATIPPEIDWDYLDWSE